MPRKSTKNVDIEKLKIVLKDLIANNKIDDVFHRLRKDLLRSQSERYDDTILIESKYRDSLRAGTLELIDLKDKNLQFANINQALIWLIKEITEADLQDTALLGKPAFGFHALSCDRNEQFDYFDTHQPVLLPGSLHFFYLYGGERQAHQSFFKRIYLELKGQYALQPNRPVAAVDLVVEDCSNPQILRDRFLRNLYSALGLNPADHHPLAQQNFADLLLKAEKTRDLRKGSYLCLFVHISHWYWNRQITPDVARWFIDSFCPAQLDPDSPTVLFFFAFDFNEDDNPGVRDEVLEVINRDAERVKRFPELDMVAKRDVAQWLVRHQRHFSVTQRQQILQQLLPEYHMAELEPLLHQLINEYFNTQVHEY